MLPWRSIRMTSCKKPVRHSRMFIDLDSYKRAEAMIDSPNWGLLFCIGTFSQMEGGARNIFDAI